MVMPIDLKDASATYQSTDTAIFHDMLYKCNEDYVEDIVVKSKEVSQYVNSLRTSF